MCNIVYTMYNNAVVARAASREAREAEIRRSLVLQATRQLLSRKGVDEISMEDIANAAGYTRRAIYNYFKGSDDVFLSLFVEEQRTRWAFQQERVRDAATGMAKLRAWATALCRYREMYPHYGRLEGYWDFHGVYRIRVRKAVFASFREINERLADGLREIFRLGVADGTMRPDLDVDMCVSQFLYSFRAIAQRAESSAYSFAEFDRRTYINHFLNLFAIAIGNAGGVDGDRL